MRRVLCIVVMLSAIAGMFAGCQKREEQPVPKTQQIPAVPLQSPMGQIPAQPLASPHGDTAGTAMKVDKAIVVPDSVKGKWRGVVLLVEDKGSGKSSEYPVSLKSAFAIPASDLKVQVGDLLPDFSMTGDSFTSVSNEPNNPAVRVEIFKAGKSVFKGWLFEKYPSIHPFEDPKYAVTLKKGLKN